MDYEHTHTHTYACTRTHAHTHTHTHTHTLTHMAGRTIVFVPWLLHSDQSDRSIYRN